MDYFYGGIIGRVRMGIWKDILFGYIYKRRISIENKIDWGLSLSLV